MLEKHSRYGAPSKCTGDATEENFRKFFQYGNHGSATKNPTKLMEVFTKDVKRGFALAIDARFLPFTPDVHLTLIGIVNIDDRWKSERPVFDASFHPDNTCESINDWTNKKDEPDVTFPGSFIRLIVHIWNLRIS